MKTLHLSKKSGFTLVELMVVIAIIAILTGIIITNLVASKAKSRDAKRASDLSQIALAIEQFFDRCDVYPTTIVGDPTTITSTNCPSGVYLSNFISKIPTDPSSGASYGYATNPTNTDYVLHTTFESTNSVSNQSAPLPSTVTGSSWAGYSFSFSCTNDAAHFDYCVRPN